MLGLRWDDINTKWRGLTIRDKVEGTRVIPFTPYVAQLLAIPAGVVAQLMGHKPSETAEKHYTVRPLDLLRVHHEKIEAWILEQAGIVFDAKAVPGALRVVTG